MIRSMFMEWSEEGSSHKMRWAKTIPVGGSSKHRTCGDLMAGKERHCGWNWPMTRREIKVSLVRKLGAKFYRTLGIMLRRWVLI